MTPAPDPGRVLRRAVLAWGLGHLALGHVATGWFLLAAEVVGIALVAWLTVGLADTSAYVVPFVAGAAFLVAWGWQAVAAYREARSASGAAPATSATASPATAIGWLSLPLLAWMAGFWLVGASAATPAAALDRFVTAWTAGGPSGSGWAPDVVEAAREASDAAGSGQGRLRDVRISIVDDDGSRATAVAEVIHYERQPTRFLWVFPGTELVPVPDERLLRLQLVAVPAQLPGGIDIGAVRWKLADASAGG